MTQLADKPDPQLDLLFERDIALAPEQVWAAWTTPEHLKHWFTPAPWQTVDCEIDLRPGGIFRTVMRSPEGQEFPNLGCYLEIVPHRKLVWTNTLGPGYRPATLTGPDLPDCGTFAFTAMLLLEPHHSGTKYRALVMHSDEAGRKQHQEMGFHDGWGAALDQLVAYMQQV